MSARIFFLRTSAMEPSFFFVTTITKYSTHLSLTTSEPTETDPSSQIDQSNESKIFQ